MSDAPKQIWCFTGLYYTYVNDWSESSWSKNDDSGVEYTRTDLVRAQIEARDAAIAELVEGLRALVKQNEDWNAAVMQVTGKPAGWTDKYLSPARALIAKHGDKR